ncbi:MAG TPA: TfoX/Sxy family protein [Coriobacteriia bacterium]|jgi:TfoX/Sxy family transcriptional regulator of competence genes
MSYDEELDARVAEIVVPWGATRQKMFGGTGYLVNGNMMAGVHKDRLVLRLGDEAGAKALQQPSVRPFDITGRPMKGWVMVEPPAVAGAELADWLALARGYAESLPPKG